ncbi:hypothetical protein K435DRAFT_865705 [Dendrothele bispora CBS 962.96]|uniref:Uncharacterized protein n=1 Tax=Dendrothele bispora (strain CBS 962.96) TaxID=1314807 RepID=A0A4S8LJ22_DENBC|nr:hypothetical protein K435DRAFT_865703 [Dendrothele bispora CBS 962.96]THU89015.1 hypothetical protein K435DRAFT_865705 [Dendrothele bispora CBS 962.96]
MSEPQNRINHQYYRGHTFMSNENSNPTLSQEPPPPYTPPQSSAPNQANERNQQLLAFEVPLNTNVVGGVQSVTTFHMSCSTTFADGFNRICGQMGLSVESATLGYKYVGRDTGPPHALGSAQEWNDCLAKGSQYLLRRRTRDVVCKIYNLNMARTVAPSNAVVGTLKRKSTGQSGSGSKRQETLKSGYKTEENELTEKYKCSVHKGRLCYVKADHSHEFIEPYELSLWAKELTLARQRGHDNPTPATPPHNIVFQRFFLTNQSRIDKRPGRQPRPATEVHTHFHLPPNTQLPLADVPIPTTHVIAPSSTPPLASVLRSPLADISSHANTAPSPSLGHAFNSGKSQNTVPEVNISESYGSSTQKSDVHGSGEQDLTDQLANDAAIVTYPSVMAALKLMDKTPGPSSMMNMVDLYPRLQEYGFAYVHLVALLAFDWSFFSDIIGMPLDRVGSFIEICRTMTLRAETQQTHLQN